MGIALSAVLSLSACSHQITEDPTASNWSWESPAHFPEPVFKFDKLAYTEESFQLGKQLFFDPLLSRDKSISCGSCHHQINAFADPGKALSDGVDEQKTTRNSPALINLAWQTNFMWDGGINHLELVPFAPITNPLEMDESLHEVINKLSEEASYQKQFNAVFGTTNIDGQKILLALSHYMATLISDNSKFDKYLKNEASLSALEFEGYALFKTHCNSCHTEPLFHANNFANNGLETHPKDVGRYLITLNPKDSGVFKVPTLRNVAVTYPYMHDGRFNTLSEVLNHYRFGINASATLSNELPAEGILLTDKESEAIIAFLETLTDEEFITNPHLE